MKGLKHPTRRIQRYYDRDKNPRRSSHQRHAYKCPICIAPDGTPNYDPSLDYCRYFDKFGVVAELKKNGQHPRIVFCPGFGREPPKKKERKFEIINRKVHAIETKIRVTEEPIKMKMEVVNIAAKEEEEVRVTEGTEITLDEVPRTYTLVLGERRVETDDKNLAMEFLGMMKQHSKSQVTVPRHRTSLKSEMHHEVTVESTKMHYIIHYKSGDVKIKKDIADRVYRKMIEIGKPVPSRDLTNALGDIKQEKLITTLFAMINAPNPVARRLKAGRLWLYEAIAGKTVNISAPEKMG